MWAPIGLLAAVLLLAIFFVAQKPFGLDDDTSVQWVQFGLAAAAVAVLGWGYQLAKEGRPSDRLVLRDRLLLVIGLSSFLGYFNFGHLHFGNFVHVWDTYHYVMGSKYFPELGYDKLYDCAAVVDLESGRKDELRRRTLTDLRNNLIVRPDEIIAHPERCKESFSPARWEAFKKDINTFHGLVNEGRWKEIHQDHGYNATPVWTLAGAALTNAGPVSMGQLTRLNLLDPIYLALTLLMVWWAFGPRAFAVAALTLGTNFANRYYWTGGAFLRHDWVFYLVASICLLKKDRPFLGGMAFAYATLLRLFPGLAVLGPIIAAVEYYREHRTLDRRFVRWVAGGAVGTALLVGASFAAFGGVTTWERFAQNTLKHSNTPLTNHMGLRTVLSWRPNTIGQRMVDNTQIDSWAKWKATRLAKWREAQPVFWCLMALAIWLVWLAVQRARPLVRPLPRHRLHRLRRRADELLLLLPHGHRRAPRPAPRGRHHLGGPRHAHPLHQLGPPHVDEPLARRAVRRHEPRVDLRRRRHLVALHQVGPRGRLRARPCTRPRSRPLIRSSAVTGAGCQEEKRQEAALTAE